MTKLAKRWTVRCLECDDFIEVDGTATKAEARKLLAKAGWSDRNGLDDFRCPDCAPYEELEGQGWSMVIEMTAVSQNVLKRKYRHHAAYAKLRDAYRILVRNQMRLRGVPPAKCRRRVYLTRLMTKGERSFDRGNLIGGLKPMLDALKLEGAIVDDSEQWCDDRYAQDRHKFTPAILVALEDL